MRARPKLVYFSTPCEPILPVEAVLDDLHEIMVLLFDVGVSLPLPV